MQTLAPHFDLAGTFPSLRPPRTQHDLYRRPSFTVSEDQPFAGQLARSEPAGSLACRAERVRPLHTSNRAPVPGAIDQRDRTPMPSRNSTAETTVVSAQRSNFHADPAPRWTRPSDAHTSPASADHLHRVPDAIQVPLNDATTLNGSRIDSTAFRPRFGEGLPKSASRPRAPMSWREVDPAHRSRRMFRSDLQAGGRRHRIEPQALSARICAPRLDGIQFLDRPEGRDTRSSPLEVRPHPRRHRPSSSSVSLIGFGEIDLPGT